MLYFIDTNYIYYFLNSSKPSDSDISNFSILKDPSCAASVCIPSCAVYEYFIANRRQPHLAQDIIAFFSGSRVFASNNLFNVHSDDIERIVNENQKVRFKELNNKWLKTKIKVESQILTQISLVAACALAFSMLNEDDSNTLDVVKRIAGKLHGNTDNIIMISQTALTTFYSPTHFPSGPLFEAVILSAIHLLDELWSKNSLVIPCLESFSGNNTVLSFCGNIMKEKNFDFITSFDESIAITLRKKDWNDLGVAYLRLLENNYFQKKHKFVKNDIMDLMWLLASNESTDEAITYVTGDKRLKLFLLQMGRTVL